MHASLRFVYFRRRLHAREDFNDDRASARTGVEPTNLIEDAILGSDWGGGAARPAWPWGLPAYVVSEHAIEDQGAIGKQLAKETLDDGPDARGRLA